MNPAIQVIAKELATQINAKINIPFLNEQQEQVFFELVVSKVLELVSSIILKHLEKQPE
jgi:hypothetical protein